MPSGAHSMADPAVTPRSGEVVDLLREAFLAVKRQVAIEIEGAGLSYTEWGSLHECAQGPIRGGELAQSIGLSSAGVTDVVDRLERRGLVRRSRDPVDRRALRLEMTEEGRRLHAELRRKVLRRVGETVEQLGPVEYRALATGLRAFNRRELARAGRRPLAA